MAEPLILPDSRPRITRNRVWRVSGWWVPIFCANCGADGGQVPEESMTFAFYLCNDCAKTWGNVEGTYAEPDVVFWERVKQEQLDKYGRLLTPDELLRLYHADASPLATLLREGAPKPCSSTG